MKTRFLPLVVIAALAPGQASAHAGHFEAGGGGLLAWDLHPLVVVPWLAAALFYARGLRYIRHRPAAGAYRLPAIAFYAGLAVIALALVSPLDHLGAVSVSAHMVQHMLLIQVAAPLIILGSPAVVLLLALRGTPALLRRGVRWLRLPSLLVTPVSVLLLHAAALLAWHLPRLYDAALASEAAHIAQHAAFLGTGLLFWRAVLPRAGRLHGLGATLGLLFVMTVVSGGLGALLSLSPLAWYAYQDTSLFTALEDQQIAGALMWVVGAMLYALAACWVFIAVLNRMEQPSPTQHSASGAGL